ncbi:RNA polymerase I-specific transcription initiation factor RRN6-like protein [Xylaria bambusicola]|uniref:RNA polymerase I-specific transcription initiation factor RRN6-like protein n=1 Tax=Xylaria bambusicola TaxID=326684 RepID=UPI00200786DF|nr:RNA polymerase I-specific transcription initiation factor RRN6-like protein [Xylaria bambusicola]KAI0518242.1 RNA polymerase I-specific transcription initiation factor RRN6-like protein [Xylaria bambusicola]
MTERHLVESAVGLAGRLSHIPYGTNKAEDCGWRSSRNVTRNAPVFKALGLYKTWISPEPDRVSDSQPLSGTLWEQSRRQQNWLLKHHPEASLGNNLLHDCLEEEESLFPSQQDYGCQTCFVSLGELTDTSLRKHAGIPLVVAVTGSANNVLRLARLDQERWAWPQEPNIATQLVGLAPEKPAFWIDDNDVGPIHRVKCIVDHKPYSPTRWLAVQRDSGTTIFQPEYRKASVDESFGRDSSPIAANPLFHVSREQTGGNIHSDVSFNPGTRSNPPQLAIVDERGFWSVWDVKYNSKPKTTREPISRLRTCGHIERGVLGQIPHRDRSAVAWHKILWVGRSEDHLDLLGNLDLNLDHEDSTSQVSSPPLQRSSSLLVCNLHQVKLLDVIAGVYLPDLNFCRPDSLDCVLDVHIAHDPQFFYVLTTSKLFIVRVYSTPGVEWDKPEKIWSIVFSTPHYRSCFDHSLKLAVTQGLKPVHVTSFVHIYSSTNSWIDLFHVEFSSTDLSSVLCQANVTGLGSLQKTLNSAIRTLYISPAPIIVKTPKSHTKLGNGLVEKRIRFYQVLALRADMSVVSVVCASSSLPSLPIVLPRKYVGRRTKAEYRNDEDLRRLPSEFIVDDSLAILTKDSPTIDYRNIKAFYEHLSTFSEELEQDSTAGSAKASICKHNPFEAVHQYAEEAVSRGLLPISTLLRIMPNFKSLSRHSLSGVEWEDELEILNNVHPGLVLCTIGSLRSCLRFSAPGPLQEVYSRLLELSNNSLHRGGSDDENGQRIVSISEEITYDLYLSLHSISYRNAGGDSLQTTTEETMLLDSQPESLPSSPQRPESPTSSAWSQRSNSEAVENEDPAMSLLRAYTGTGNFVPQKKLELLDKWKLGMKPSEYTFDLDRSGDADAGKLRRAKQQAREERKRRRAQTLIHLSQEPELPATQPAPETAFYSSQPRGMSSQQQITHSDPVHMMSQPAAGTFGRRPTKKIKKRKGGF